MTEQNRVAARQTWLSMQTTKENLKILPVELPIVAHLYDLIEVGNGAAVKLYKTADGKEVPNLDAFKSLFEQRKAGTLLFTEVSKGEVTTTAGEPSASRAEIVSPAQPKAEDTTRAKKYMLDKNEKDFKVALRAVYEADPELKAMAAGITPEGAQKADAGKASMERQFKK